MWSQNYEFTSIRCSLRWIYPHKWVINMWECLPSCTSGSLRIHEKRYTFLGDLGYLVSMDSLLFWGRISLCWSWGKFYFYLQGDGSSFFHAWIPFVCIRLGEVGWFFGVIGNVWYIIMVITYMACPRFRPIRPLPRAPLLEKASNLGANFFYFIFIYKYFW